MFFPRTRNWSQEDAWHLQVIIVGEYPHRIYRHFARCSAETFCGMSLQTQAARPDYLVKHLLPQEESVLPEDQELVPGGYFASPSYYRRRVSVSDLSAFREAFCRDILRDVSANPGRQARLFSETSPAAGGQCSSRGPGTGPRRMLGISKLLSSESIGIGCIGISQGVLQRHSAGWQRAGLGFGFRVRVARRFVGLLPKRIAVYGCKPIALTWCCRRDSIVQRQHALPLQLAKGGFRVWV